eukprot:scaffold103073_cov41-Tisochrysis_lutea.AAC.3
MDTAEANGGLPEPYTFTVGSKQAIPGLEEVCIHHDYSLTTACGRTKEYTDHPLMPAVPSTR